MRSSHGGREQGEDRKPQLVQVTGSSRRAWRWLIRGARRRGQYLAGCEPVCGVITCSGRQDACQRLSPIGNRGSARGPHGVDGMITHPVRCCSVPPTLCREFSTPPVHGAQQMDVHPVRRGPHVRRLCAAHAALSPPAALVFVPFCAVEMPSPDGPVRHEMQARASRRQGTLPSSLPHCFFSVSLPLSPPRCLAAALRCRLVRPSVRSSVPASLSPSLPPSSLFIAMHFILAGHVQATGKSISMCVTRCTQM